MPKTDDMEYAGSSEAAAGNVYDTGSSGGSTGKRLALSGILLVIAMLLMLRSTCEEQDQKGAIGPRINRLVPAATVAGAHIADAVDAPRVLLLTRPEESGTYRKKVINKVVASLEDGLGENGEVTATAGPAFTEEIATTLDPDLADEPEKLRKLQPPLSTWFTPDVLKNVVNSHPDCNVAVSIVGLPEAQQTSESGKSLLSALSELQPVKFMVIQGSLPDPGITQRAFQKGLFLGLVLHREANVDQVLPPIGDPDMLDTFRQQYTLVTPENIGFVAKEQQDILDVNKSLE